MTRRILEAIILALVLVAGCQRTPRVFRCHEVVLAPDAWNGRDGCWHSDHKLSYEGGRWLCRCATDEPPKVDLAD